MFKISTDLIHYTQTQSVFSKPLVRYNITAALDTSLPKTPTLCHLNDSLLKQELKQLQKQLQSHPTRTDIKLKIIEIQKLLKKRKKK